MLKKLEESWVNDILLVNGKEITMIN